ncbi:MAG TPA: glycogen/starch/alpha-glucan phosphorylase [Victivallales bacterium]|nr:glycogen/starch/alpha-glucan phosphorylase [Victivallales bacterium]
MNTKTDAFVREGISKKNIKETFNYHLTSSLAERPDRATDHDKYMALALTIRELLVDKWIATRVEYEEKKQKCVCYLSLEYLMGRVLDNALINLEIQDKVREALKELGIELTSLEEQEPDAGLGNGGLGRLAACFLDSMTTLQLPAFGYGIRYDYGIFKQKIQDGYQVEEPDPWLKQGNPWEIVRPERAKIIRFYGRTEQSRHSSSKYKREWIGTEDVLAMPYDYPIPGFRTSHVNNLRLWSAQPLPSTEFNLSKFNQGDYINANLNASLVENITKVLYPNDNNYEGKELRLKQQYFLVSATLQDIILRCKFLKADLRKLDENVIIQLNDTHPALAIPELMRILVDEENIDWDEAWSICTKTFAYTNHTLMSEALEKWPVSLMTKLLPRHMEIIFDINQKMLRKIANKYPGNMGKIQRMSFIEEGNEKKIRMAYIAVAGSSRVNGVAKLHTELLKHGLFKDFYEYTPHKFVNVTNGITPRRWILKANPSLSKIITEKIGTNWINDLFQLEKILKFEKDEEFLDKIRQSKNQNKKNLAKLIFEKYGLKLDTDAIFDIQVKRIHEYKRQTLNILHVIDLYLKLKDGKIENMPPHVFLFGGKAAPGYFMAKLIIKFINSVAAVINNDDDIDGMLKVLFLEDYGVSLAEKIIPAADISEQISLAGTEASGTGNMKFALNGALTIGTMDGANVEICEEVGRENILIFGMTVDEVKALLSKGYNASEFIEKDEYLKRILDLIKDGFFSYENKDLFKPLLDNLRYDPFMVMADFASYREIHEEAWNLYLNKKLWTQKTLCNIAKMGKFSSDRAIKEYAEKIWHVEPMIVSEKYDWRKHLDKNGNGN